MKREHSITHHFQPTNMSCSQAATASLLSFFGVEKSPEDIMKAVPVYINEEGEEAGTMNQCIATWLVQQGFTVTIYSSDFIILDLSWIGLAKEQLLERLRAVEDSRDHEVLGKHASRLYVQSYREFLEAGGEIVQVPCITEELLDQCLTDSPLLVLANYNVLYTKGRNRNGTLREVVSDDVNGYVGNHSIVLYGKNELGNYMIADPFEEPGRLEIEPKKLTSAITAAQIECDSYFIQIQKDN